MVILVAGDLSKPLFQDASGQRLLPNCSGVFKEELQALIDSPSYDDLREQLSGLLRDDCRIMIRCSVLTRTTQKCKIPDLVSRTATSSGHTNCSPMVFVAIKDCTL
jgi:hypothetical protein